MGVGYFDRPDHKGAKAGNLNHALSLTGAPYIVTLDADMIPKSDFLLKTIPYFVDAEKRNRELPPEERASLGLLQTPQCFYSPDVFQHALYSERRAPNEQDFFYRSIEVAKTASNSVIYGGSNTVLARSALEAIGGFYTESITEDFATGLLIEAAGFLSLGIAEPLASGRTPHTFAEHVRQRAGGVQHEGVERAVRKSGPVFVEGIVHADPQGEKAAHAGPDGPGIKKVRAGADQGGVFHAEAQGGAQDCSDVAAVPGVVQDDVGSARVQLVREFLEHGGGEAVFLAADPGQGAVRFLHPDVQLLRQGAEPVGPFPPGGGGMEQDAADAVRPVEQAFHAWEDAGGVGVIQAAFIGGKGGHITPPPERSAPSYCPGKSRCGSSSCRTRNRPARAASGCRCG